MLCHSPSSEYVGRLTNLPVTINDTLPVNSTDAVIASKVGQLTTWLSQSCLALGNSVIKGCYSGDAKKSCQDKPVLAEPSVSVSCVPPPSPSSVSNSCNTTTKTYNTTVRMDPGPQGPFLATSLTDAKNQLNAQFGMYARSMCNSNTTGVSTSISSQCTQAMCGTDTNSVMCAGTTTMTAASCLGFDLGGNQYKFNCPAWNVSCGCSGKCSGV